jgi:hypothetical protein
MEAESGFGVGNDEKIYEDTRSEIENYVRLG